MGNRSAVLVLVATFASRFDATAQSSSFEESVPAPLFSIDGIARAAQLVPDQGACVFASNALIGPLGDADILLLRVNKQGAILHDLVIGDAGGQGYHDVAKEVVQADKHYYVTGYTRAVDTSAAHTFTAMLIKVDTALNFEWQKNYILPGQEMYAEVMTPFGLYDLLVAGKIYDGTEFNSFVMRTDSAGVPVWIKQYTMPQGETVQCVRRLPGGDILLCGSMVFGFELVLPFVCKLNSDGDFLWGKYYNYPPGFVERSAFLFMHASSVDDIQLAGYTDKFGAGATDLFVVDIDSSGAVNWARTYGGPQFDEPEMARFDNATNELVMAGSSGSFASSGAPYPMAARIADDGTFMGAALYGDTGVYLPGRFHHSCRVGPDNNLLMGSRDAPADDLYLVGVNSDMANACAYHPVAMGVGLQTTGTGAFTATVTTPAPLTNDSALVRSHFAGATMLCDQQVGERENDRPAAGLELFPSPGDGSFRIRTPNGRMPEQVSVYDPHGRSIIWTGDPRGGIRLPADLASGLYRVEAMDGSGRRLSAPYLLVRP